MVTGQTPVSWTKIRKIKKSIFLLVCSDNLGILKGLTQGQTGHSASRPPVTWVRGWSGPLIGANTEHRQINVDVRGLAWLLHPPPPTHPLTRHPFAFSVLSVRFRFDCVQLLFPNLSLPELEAAATTMVTETTTHQVYTRAQRVGGWRSGTWPLHVEGVPTMCSIYCLMYYLQCLL